MLIRKNVVIWAGRLCRPARDGGLLFGDLACWTHAVRRQHHAAYRTLGLFGHHSHLLGVCLYYHILD